ncbi:DoxX family protein [Emticicia sp. TH156]|uniref:DoxX family protein n=1 Tax=Emticicia sp. TH156 TaxID=2067454 RepID=UPI000C7917AB|nr:DoxX family protein [Emticicia sp. TH156]PLK42968.1 DoxX family protein [Emticicia sp. TH156]
MKRDNIIFWVATTIIFLWEGVMPALTSQTELAKEGISHLGYPAYFGVMLTVYKVTGSIALILPVVPARIKEWAYAGLSFSLLSAFISHWAVDGMNAQTPFPLIILAILMVSYVYYHKLKTPKEKVW